jgi:hypothetical protein
MYLLSNMSVVYAGRNEQVEDEELDLFLNLIATIQRAPVAIDNQSDDTTATPFTDDNKVC